MRVLVALSMFLIGLSGCASDQANRYYGTERFAAVSPEQVEILPSPPSRAYTVIADFQARNTSAESMRKQAAEIGADAVIVTLLGGYASHDQQWARQDNYSNTYSRITGTAIKYKGTP